MFKQELVQLKKAFYIRQLYDYGKSTGEKCFSALVKQIFKFSEHILDCTVVITTLFEVSGKWPNENYVKPNFSITIKPTCSKEFSIPF